MAHRLIMLFALGTLLVATPVGAQEANEGLSLRLRKDFGFGMGGWIQGTFTMSIVGPEGLAQVFFLIDGQVVSVDREPPFRYRFHTGDFALGRHTLAAEAMTADGRRLRSEERTVEFVSPEVAWGMTRRILIPVLVGVGVLTLLGFVGTLALERRRRPWRSGEYGLAGGAVCPACGFPYARHLLSLNLLVGKIERCPHCRKWAVVGRATAAELAAAEARLAEEGRRGGLEQESEAAHLRRLIDESRYED
jgi:hypothetical protein